MAENKQATEKQLQSTLDIVTLDLREIRYRGQIFGAPTVPM